MKFSRSGCFSIICMIFSVLNGCTEISPSNPVEGNETIEVIRSNTAGPEESYLPADTLRLVLNGALTLTTQRNLAFSTDSGTISQDFPRDAILSESPSEIKVMIPYQWEDQKNCRLSVQTDSDTIHSRFFSVKQLILQKPVKGMVFHPGDTMEIRWRTSSSFNVAAYLRPVVATESKLLMPEASVTTSMDQWPAIWPSFYYVVAEDDLCDECILSIEDYLDPVVSDYTRGFAITPPVGVAQQ